MKYYIKLAMILDTTELTQDQMFLWLKDHLRS